MEKVGKINKKYIELLEQVQKRARKLAWRISLMKND